MVRAGIGGIDLAAAVGGLRQTGFKPSDVAAAGPSVFTGQGRRGSDGRHVAAPPLSEQRTAHLAPPQPSSVEYVEEGQEEEVVVRAGTSEFLGARSGLNKTGLSDRLRETSQPPPPPPPPQQQQQQAPVTEAAAAPSALGVGQWQGLPQQGQQSAAPSAPWQQGAAGLRRTGL